MQRLPDPRQFFADPVQEQQKISEEDVKEAQQRYKQFTPAQPRPEVKSFKEINNPQNFQIQNFQNEIRTLKNSLADLEKRFEQFTQQQRPQQQPPQQQPLFNGRVPIPQVQKQPLQPQQQFFQPPPQVQQHQQPPVQAGGGGFTPFRGY